MPICPACGNPALADKPFCADCGALLHATSAPTETSHRDRGPAEVTVLRSPSAVARFLPGAMLAGRYRIVSLLGKGGMGEVYRADDIKLGEPVALKFLPPDLEARGDRLERFLNEVRLARQVAHPHVCRVYDVAETDGQHFISMEYVDGENLASLLKRIGRLPQDKAVELARQICSGLSAAHEVGILHRDLKPANVMIDGRGRARIADFGLAALSGELDRGDLTAGTPAYMAPEQLTGSAVTIRSDLYSLGLVFYEIFTGRRAYPAASRDEVKRLRDASGPMRPSEHIEGLDPAVERVILACLEPDPADRPRSAQAVSAALPGGDPLAAALAAGETPSPEMVAAAGEERAMEPRRALALAALVLALFAAGITIEGRHQIRAFLPEVKPPAVMIDRARDVIARLGYTESVYAEPADTAIGYGVWSRPLQEILGSDPSPARWERLRDPDAQVLTFWYRQSPQPLVPAGGLATDGRVSRWNPFPRTTGEILINLEPDGRLNQFVAVPRRFTRSTSAPAPYDWSIPFALAGLDMAGFQPTAPRYQRYMHHDQRAAWKPMDAAKRYRIEAGANEDRLAMFVKVDEGEARDLAAEPERFADPVPPDVISGFFLGVFVVGAIVARVNVRRGRADTRSALRLAIFMASLDLLANGLSSHDVLTRAGRMADLVASALISGLWVIVLYTALEPTVRATWPSMLVSWTRLLGRARLGWRDPIVGRAALAGLLAGAALLAFGSLRDSIVSALEGAPPIPGRGNWISLLGQSDAWAEIITRLGWSVFESLIVPFVMVLGRLLLRRPVPSAMAAGAVWLAPDVARALLDPGDASNVEIVVSLLFLAVVFVSMIGVLLRWGLIGVVSANVVGILGSSMAPTSDWTAWHAQPAVLCLLIVAAITAYACWAATRGWRPTRAGTPIVSASS